MMCKSSGGKSLQLGEVSPSEVATACPFCGKVTPHGVNGIATEEELKAKEFFQKAPAS